MVSKKAASYCPAGHAQMLRYRRFESWSVRAVPDPITAAIASDQPRFLLPRGPHSISTAPRNAIPGPHCRVDSVPADKHGTRGDPKPSCSATWGWSPGNDPQKRIGRGIHHGASAVASTRILAPIGIASTDHVVRDVVTIRGLAGRF